jgi:hypothetical protein
MLIKDVYKLSDSTYYRLKKKKRQGIRLVAPNEGDHCMSRTMTKRAKSIITELVKPPQRPITIAGIKQKIEVIGDKIELKTL